MNSVINAVIVTNAPAPYRVPGWRRVAQTEDIHLDVIFCTRPHIDTLLDAAAYGFTPHFLTGRYRAMERRFMHSDPGVWSLLNRLRPDVVITTGYIPTFLFAFAWAVMHGVPHVAMTDGTAQSEKSLSWLHRFVRRRVFAHSAAFVGACEGSRDLFRQYGVPDNQIHISRLCAENDHFSRTGAATSADFIFCGRFLASKRPLFAMQVAREVAIRLGRRTSIDFVGSGVMESEMRDYAAQVSDFVDTRFHGYATQAELPFRYADARIFLFPTEADVWGVVANEACAAGLPVIVSPHAGAAGELVLDGSNGYVRELDVAQWAEAAVSLLKDETRYNRFSQSSRERVAEYTFDHAARGLANAIRQARPARRVCIIQAVAKQYRLPFFDLLHERLKAENVALTVIYSAPNNKEALRKDAVDLPHAYGYKVRAYWAAGYRILYQPCLGRAMAADLVIVEHASKHVLNYIFNAMHALGLVRMAYWGHGRDRQVSPNGPGERLKRLTLHWADWWFAYTKGAGGYVAVQGYQPARITVVENSLDTRRFRELLSEITPTELAEARELLGWDAKAFIGVFCGSLYANKRFDILFQAAELIHARHPAFHLLILGGGPLEGEVRAFAETRKWVRYLGPVYDREKAVMLRLAELWLNPAAVGIGILDAFCASLPVITTDMPGHGPEIEYLEDGVNGRMVIAEAGAYADVVAALLRDATALTQLRLGARESAERYTIETMVDNFSEGVRKCLRVS